MTHYALEDVALMRVQPGLTIVVPGCSGQVDAVVRAVQPLPGPVYLRVSKQSVSVPALDGRFELGRVQSLTGGDDVAIVALGSMTEPALAASQLLAESDVSASVTVVASVSPPPVDDLISLLANVPVAISVEAHYITGGLGSLLAEVIAEHDLGTRLLRAGVQGLPMGMSGSRAYMQDELGLTPERLVTRLLTALAVRQP